MITEVISWIFNVLLKEDIDRSATIEIATVVSAGATVILAVATFGYLIELRKERHERVKPILAISKPTGCSESGKKTEEMLCMVVDNIGRGHAFDIHFDCLFIPSLERKTSVKIIKYLFKPPSSKVPSKIFSWFFGKIFSLLFDSSLSGFGEKSLIKICPKKACLIDISTGLSIEYAKNKFTALLFKMKYKDELGKEYKKIELIDFQNYVFLRNMASEHEP